MTEQTDENIAKLVQNGDSHLFGSLVERYDKKLMRYAKRFLFDYEDAEDLIQDVFIKAFKNIKGFDASRSFSSWIYRIAHNEFINEIKKRGREPISFFDPDTLFPHPIAPKQADDELKEQELKTLVDEYINKLSPKYREPLVLYYYEDLSYEQIAEILHIPVSTVGVRINRAKQTLKKLEINV